MSKMGIVGQLAFFSSIPIGSNVSVEDIAKYSFLAPIIVGPILAIIEFSSYTLLHFVLGVIAGILLIGIIELLRGFNHLDGLLDLGDALMVKGDRERKIKALKDVQIGSGGIGLLVVYLSFQTVAMLKLEGYSIMTLLNLISADVISRSFSLLVLASIKPMNESNLGKLFNQYLKNKIAFLVIETIPFISLYNVIMFMILYVIFYKICKSLGGSSGDITGAAITISFSIFLLVNEATHLNYSVLSMLL